jgi:urease beta subunit
MAQSQGVSRSVSHPPFIQWLGMPLSFVWGDLSLATGRVIACNRAAFAGRSGDRPIQIHSGYHLFLISACDLFNSVFPFRRQRVRRS